MASGELSFNCLCSSYPPHHFSPTVSVSVGRRKSKRSHQGNRGLRKSNIVTQQCHKFSESCFECYRIVSSFHWSLSFSFFLFVIFNTDFYGLKKFYSNESIGGYRNNLPISTKSQADVMKRQKKNIRKRFVLFRANNKEHREQKEPPETSPTCAVGDVCPACQRHCANTVGAGPPLTDDQVVNHWSEQINSQHVHLLATLSGSPSVCVFISGLEPSKGPIGAHQVAAICVLQLDPQHGSLCGRLLHACMRLMTLTIKCHISPVQTQRMLRMRLLVLGWGGANGSATWERTWERRQRPDFWQIWSDNKPAMTSLEGRERDGEAVKQDSPRAHFFALCRTNMEMWCVGVSLRHFLTGSCSRVSHLLGSLHASTSPISNSYLAAGDGHGCTNRADTRLSIMKCDISPQSPLEVLQTYDSKYQKAFSLSAAIMDMQKKDTGLAIWWQAYFFPIGCVLTCL